MDTLTDHVRTELGVKSSERLDTFRRKFKNFQLGDLGTSAERRLQAMRLSAEQVLYLTSSSSGAVSYQ